MAAIDRNRLVALGEVAATAVFLVLAFIAGLALMSVLIWNAIVGMDDEPIRKLWSLAAVIVAARNGIAAVYAVDAPTWKAARAYLLWSAAILTFFFIAWRN